MLKIQDAAINPGTQVLVRCDLDVPVTEGVILERYRLDSALETLSYVISKGGFPLIAGHMGKPDGKYELSLSTKHLFPYFCAKLGQGNFELLENLRFDEGEEENNQDFAKKLASKADLYVNESFATSHRKHASIVSVPQLLPHCAGFRLQKEISVLDSLVKSAEKPFVAIVGGAKLESKMPVISKFLKIADIVLLGGKLGLSWEEPVPSNLLIPTDYVSEKDIGPKTIEEFKTRLNSAKTVLWAGPLGMYEEDKYSNGTREIACEIAGLTDDKKVKSVVGGGDTLAAVEKFSSIDKFTFASTGGGAMLQYLVDGTLPGIEALN
jgi:phosphoglycerate kinase